jgi:hypothetical protein
MLPLTRHCALSESSILTCTSSFPRAHARSIRDHYSYLRVGRRASSRYNARGVSAELVPIAFSGLAIAASYTEHVVPLAASTPLAFAKETLPAKSLANS